MKRRIRVRQSSLSLFAACTFAAAGLFLVVDASLFTGALVLLIAPAWLGLANRERRRERRELAGAPSRLVLRGVERGILNGRPPPPALTKVIEEGYVNLEDDGRYVLTAEGRRELDAD